LRARWDLKPSRPWPRLSKMVSRPSLKTSSLQIIQQSCRLKTVVKFIDLQSCYLFVVRQFFMVAFMLDMHSTSNSTAMKFFPISTSCSIYKVNEQWTVYFVSIDNNNINGAIFLNSLHYLWYWSRRDVVVATDWY